MSGSGGQKSTVSSERPSLRLQMSCVVKEAVQKSKHVLLNLKLENIHIYKAGTFFFLNALKMNSLSKFSTDCEMPLLFQLNTTLLNLNIMSTTDHECQDTLWAYRRPVEIPGCTV